MSNVKSVPRNDKPSQRIIPSAVQSMSLVFTAHNFTFLFTASTLFNNKFSRQRFSVSLKNPLYTTWPIPEVHQGLLTARYDLQGKGHVTDRDYRQWVG